MIVGVYDEPHERIRAVAVGNSLIDISWQIPYKGKVKNNIISILIRQIFKLAANVRPLTDRRGLPERIFSAGTKGSKTRDFFKLSKAEKILVL